VGVVVVVVVVVVVTAVMVVTWWRWQRLATNTHRERGREMREWLHGAAKHRHHHRDHDQHQHYYCKPLPNAAP
jgi:hypothetical protein